MTRVVGLVHVIALCVVLFVLLCVPRLSYSFFFFFNDPAPTEISPLPLHDALPISWPPPRAAPPGCSRAPSPASRRRTAPPRSARARTPAPAAPPAGVRARALRGGEIGRAHV